MPCRALFSSALLLLTGAALALQPLRAADAAGASHPAKLPADAAEAGTSPSPATAAAAKPPARIPIKDFFDNPKYTAAQISPDGKHVAFLAPANNRLNVWVCETGAPLATAKAITHEKGRAILGFDWANDSRWILYTHDDNGDENFHVFRADPAHPAAKALDLTPKAGTRGDLIDLPRETPGQVLVQWNPRDAHYFDAYRIDIATGKAEVVAQNPGDVDSWYADTHGKILAAAAMVKGVKTEIRVRADEAAPFHTIATYTDEEDAGIHQFSKDGTFLWVTSARDSNTKRLVKLDIATGQETVVDQDPEYDVEGPLFSEVTHELIGVAYYKDRLTYKPYDPQLTKDLEILGQVHDGDISLGSSTLDERKWIVTFNSPTDPGAAYVYDRDTGTAKFLLRPRPWLKPETLVDMQPVQWPSRDGLTIHGYLSLPKSVPAANLPAIMVVHGGPWLRDEWGYDAESQFLANRGYAVLKVNYRGSTGYGKAFVNAGDKEWGGKMTNDMVDGANWLIARGIADPKRFGIYGGSYGGYATLAALAFAPQVFACGVDYVGVSNLLTFMKTMPAYWETAREQLYKRVGNPETDADFLRSRSPVFSADKIRVPLFIAQGYNDPRVNHAEAEQIVAALKKNHKPVEYMVKMDEGHGFRNPENRLEFYGKMESFLAQHLSGEGK